MLQSGMAETPSDVSRLWGISSKKRDIRLPSISGGEKAKKQVDRRFRKEQIRFS